jgi:glycosidase
VQLDAREREVFALHQYLIGLRRRHGWLHDARTSALRLDNRHYVYETRHDDDALIVALNIADTPSALELSGLVVGGTGAPPEEVVGEGVVQPHGWLILRPV